MNATEATQFARQKMAEHGLAHWRFMIDRRPKRRAGQCRHGKREIGLSAWMLNQPPEADAKVRDTILHEIAHALTPGAKHGWRWQVKAREIGARARSAFDAEKEGLARPVGRYRAHCATCGRTHHMHRRPKCSYRCGCGAREILKFI